jgi:predicted phosphodiesterase
MKTIVISDVHYPFHDEVYEKVKEYIVSEQPEYLIVNGDWIDAFSVSTHPRHYDIRVSLVDEIEWLKKEMTWLHKNLPKTKKYYIIGNHEHRINAYVARNAFEMIGVSGVDFRDQIDIEGWDIVYSGIKESDMMHWGYAVGHYDKASANAGYCVTRLMMSLGTNVIQAHGHKNAMVTRRTKNGLFFGFESGCLRTLDTEYSIHSNWGHGFVEIVKQGIHTFAYNVPIVDGYFYINGKIY